MENRVAEQIRFYRKQKGLTQEQLAEAMGVSIAAVSKWEQGQSLPEISMLMELADFFDLSVDALLGYRLRSNDRASVSERLRLLRRAEELSVPLVDALSTATRFTAECIAAAVRDFAPQPPAKLIVGGGGSMNRTLMGHIAALLPSCAVMTNEALGYDSSAKEAVAFAILANEAVFARCNNAPSATGAAHPVVMGRISL